jgi:long-chain acyl-CoA synthetase
VEEFEAVATNPPRNLAELVRRHAASDGSRPALIWQNAAFTWARVDQQVDAYARGLLALALDGDGQPPRVAIALPNTPAYAILFLATLRAGLVAVPINPGYTAREFGQLLDESGAAVLIATADVQATVEWKPAHAYTMGVDLQDLARDGEPVIEAAGGDDLAVLLFTSGSLGRPKGAMLSHRALLANHTQLAAITPPVIVPDDVVLLSVPLFHAYGLNSGLGAVVFHGATGVLVEAFDPAETLRIIEEHRISAVLGVPTMFLAWSLLPDFARSFEPVRISVCGAAPLGVGVAGAFQAATGRPIFIGYGLTESAPVLTTTLASPVPKIGSIGRPLPGVDLRLVNASGGEVWSAADDALDDFDDDAPGSPGSDPGEIVVRGENLFSGYWPDGREGPDADGWWATGDIAYADGDGDVFLVDRLHELIIVNGFNVYPAEVEQVLAMHPAVTEAAVVGILNPYTGQSVKAFVVTSMPVTVEDLLGHCQRNLARFKCPGAIEFRGELPHSATGKVRKGALHGEVTADV